MIIRKFFTLLLFCIFFHCFSHLTYAAKITSNEWKDITVSPNTDIEFILDQNDFPIGSNFVSEGNTSIRFYLGEIKPRNDVIGDFIGLSGAQAFWDIQDYHLNRWNTDYKQNLSKEQILERHFEMIRDSGIKWIRFDWIWDRIYTWDLMGGTTNLCTLDGGYNFSETDLIFQMAKKYNLSILADLFLTPKKISVCPTCVWPDYAYLPPRDLYDNNCDGGICGNLKTNGSTCFNEFTKRMVERYMPGGNYYISYPETDTSYGITHWEIWNEQDWHSWVPATLKVESYLYLLKGAYETIDQIRTTSGKDLKVLFGGLALPEINLQSYYSNTLGLNINNYFDILSIHRYENILNTLTQTRQILNNNSASLKPIWITETSGGKETEAAQTAYYRGPITDLFNNRTINKLEKVFWWSSKEDYIDSANFAAYLNGSICTLNDYCVGVIKNFYRPKDVYLQMAKDISISDWKIYNQQLTAPNSNITFTVPASDLVLNKKYILNYSVQNKMSTGKTINLSILTPGDANADGVVDGLDFKIWVNHYWQTTNLGSQAGDFYPVNAPDGNINMLDYAVLFLNYKK